MPPLPPRATTFSKGSIFSTKTRASSGTGTGYKVIELPKWKKAINWCYKRLNFYRLHMLAFTFTPLLFSAIFYAANGKNHIRYIDALFMCTSAMTVTGLQSILLGDLTGFQQALLFFLMTVGSTSGVSLIVIVIRRHFFRQRFHQQIKRNPALRRKVAHDIEVQKQAAEAEERREKKLKDIRAMRDRVRKEREKEREWEEKGREREKDIEEEEEDGPWQSSRLVRTLLSPIKSIPSRPFSSGSRSRPVSRDPSVKSSSEEDSSSSSDDDDEVNTPFSTSPPETPGSGISSSSTNTPPLKPTRSPGTPSGSMGLKPISEGEDPDGEEGSPRKRKSKKKGESERKKKKRHRLKARAADLVIRRLDVPVKVNAMSVGGWLRDDPQDSGATSSATSPPDSRNGNGNGNSRALDLDMTVGGEGLRSSPSPAGGRSIQEGAGEDPELERGIEADGEMESEFDQPKGKQPTSTARFYKQQLEERNSKAPSSRGGFLIPPSKEHIEGILNESPRLQSNFELPPEGGVGEGRSVGGGVGGGLTVGFEDPPMTPTRVPMFRPSLVREQRLVSDTAIPTAATRRGRPRGVTLDLPSQSPNRPPRPASVPRRRTTSDPLAAKRSAPFLLDEDEDPLPEMSRVRTMHEQPATGAKPLMRTTTIEFAEPANRRDTFHEAPPGMRYRRNVRPVPEAHDLRPRPVRRGSVAGSSAAFSNEPPGFPRTQTRQSAMVRDFGGFPNPVTAGARFVRQRIPTLDQRLAIPKTQTLQSVNSTAGEGKQVSYLSFSAIVGRNSRFKYLTEEEEEELGGVEYRALGVLLRIVFFYWLSMQLFGVILIAPYMTTANKFDSVFGAAHVNKIWYSFFQSTSAYTNCGMSLLDASITGFQEGYPLLVATGILILAGNTAFPVFLRLVIWILYKLAGPDSRLSESLAFLLDHPRRCFIYLFPSYQTWFLVFALVVLNCTDWICFLLLDLGNPVVMQIPPGPRVLDGLVQAIAVRAAGFTIVSLSSTAPSLQLLYMVMMYIAVYPIALSIRSSNVYEEKSMGIFDEESDEEEEDQVERKGDAGTYIAFHARKQLSFDMWWLVLAVFIIAISERGTIQNPEHFTYLNVFSIMFEVSSGYGTVGLSLGLPYQNTSLSGAFTIISKLVVIAVMVRGRHRGLPVAIDRAVLLPFEQDDLAKSNQDLTEDVDPEKTLNGNGVSSPPPKLGINRQATFASQTMSVARTIGQAFKTLH